MRINNHHLLAPGMKALIIDGYLPKEDLLLSITMKGLLMPVLGMIQAHTHIIKARIH